jgi:hypothetical protein
VAGNSLRKSQGLNEERLDPWWKLTDWLVSRMSDETRHNLCMRIDRFVHYRIRPAREAEYKTCTEWWTGKPMKKHHD